MKQYYALQQAGRTADIYIFGDIVPYEWYESDVSAYGLIDQLEGLDADQINVYIDSYGGSVSEGWAIFNALRRHPARVVTYGEGFVASAALFPFMAGEERIASALSAYYFHEVMIYTEGYAEDLRQAADEAEKLTEIGINVFSERSQLSAEEVRSLMAAESWLSPAQALDYGIATAIKADNAPRQMQAVKKQIIQGLCSGALTLPPKKENPLPKQEKEREPEPETAAKTVAKEKSRILRLFERG